MYTYRVIDSHTGAIVGGAATLKAAYAKADRLDQKYGAVRYTVQRVRS
jgi:hypothetical protein